jgi:hypothetical protein
MWYPLDGKIGTLLATTRGTSEGTKHRAEQQSASRERLWYMQLISYKSLNKYNYAFSLGSEIHHQNIFIAKATDTWKYGEQK